LPWEVTSHEVDQDEAEAFEVVSTGLLLAKMGVEGCIAGSSSQALVISERNVLLSAGIFVSLGEAEVHNVNVMLAFTNAD
jgi:hypothetical protein